MNVMTSLIGTAVAAAITLTGVTYGDDLVATITSQGDAAGLATETAVLAQAIGTEAEMPSTLTCVPDAAAGKACASFAEYDYEPTGDYVYALIHTSDGGFLLYGATPDGTQRVVFDSENGGITDLSQTTLDASPGTTGLEPVETAVVDQATDEPGALDGFVDWLADVAG